MSGLSGLQAQRGPCQLASLLLLLLGPSSVFAISFHLPVNSRKCLREEIHKDLLVTGAYEITDQSGGAGGLRTHLKVRHWAGRGGKTAGVGEGRPRMGAGGHAGGGLEGCLASREALRARGRDRPHSPPVVVRGAGLGACAREPLEGLRGLGRCDRRPGVSSTLVVVRALYLLCS